MSVLVLFTPSQLFPRQLIWVVLDLATRYTHRHHQYKHNESISGMKAYHSTNYKPQTTSSSNAYEFSFHVVRHHHQILLPFSSSSEEEAPINHPTIYWEIPITPQAGRAPALPVFLLSSFSPLPRSSVPAWTTTVRPRTLSGPISLMNLSETVPSALPWASVLKLPRSPTWRSLSEGAPWVLLWGLTG